MKNLSIIVLFVIAIIFSSCVTVQQTKLKVNDSDAPVIFMSKLPIKQYSETTHFEASGSIFHSNKKILQKLKEKGKKEGVDAIINVQFGYTFWWPKVTGIGIKYDN